MKDVLLTPEETTEIVGVLLDAAHISENEEQFKIKAEGILERLCGSRNIFCRPGGGGGERAAKPPFFPTFTFTNFAHHVTMRTNQKTARYIR